MNGSFKHDDSLPDIDNILIRLENDQFVSEQLDHLTCLPKFSSEHCETDILLHNVEVVRKKLSGVGHLIGRNHLLKKRIRRLQRDLNLQQGRIGTLERQYEQRVQLLLFERMKSSELVAKEGQKRRPRKKLGTDDC